jgi:hypothetical protein
MDVRLELMSRKKALNDLSWPVIPAADSNMSRYSEHGDGQVTAKNGTFLTKIAAF